MEKPENIAVGIDLGLETISVGVCWNEDVEIIANEHGHLTTPVCVAFTDTGILIGEEAKLQHKTNPSNTVYDLKRLIGRKFSDPEVNGMPLFALVQG